MKLTILGTGSATPSLERGSSSYIVTADRSTVLVDIGPAVVKRLIEYGFSIEDIDVIALTHFHVDHTADLASFLFACNYGVPPREKPLLIVGGKGIHKFYRGLKGVYPWIQPKSYGLTVRSLPRSSIRVGGLTMKTAHVTHNPESTAFRLEAGASLVFSGDTDYSKNLARLASTADLLVVDCSCPERKIKGHLNLALLDRLVREAKPKRVILSHLYPDWEDFRGVLHPPYLLGEDGLEVEF
ncbi:MAG TPA: MBL fold metallo-hydrolase [Syntrophorhabdaceae bacterium]|nr:MBL fold metallo-hydrolase [Syntrophorhabdaceae bacterium]